MADNVTRSTAYTSWSMTSSDTGRFFSAARQCTAADDSASSVAEVDDSCSIYVPLFIDDDGTIAEYEVLGSGSYGVVTLATVTTEDGEEVTGALKRPAPGVRTADSLTSELRFLMPLQGHRSIVQVLAHARAGEQATAMLMTAYKYSLRDVIDSFPASAPADTALLAATASDSTNHPAAPLQLRIPLAVLWGFILPLAHALLSLEHNGVVHGDLKPDNVMLNCNGQPVLIDFGSAKRRGAAVRFPFGTPAYMAPEVAAASATPIQADPSADVYTFALLVIELATGTAPEAVCKEHISELFTFDERLASLLEDSLSEAPADRIDMFMWADNAREACKLLRCGSLSATRPLVAAARVHKYAASAPMAALRTTPSAGETSAACSAVPGGLAPQQPPAEHPQPRHAAAARPAVPATSPFADFRGHMPEQRSAACGCDAAAERPVPVEPMTVTAASRGRSPSLSGMLPGYCDPLPAPPQQSACCIPGSVPPSQHAGASHSAPFPSPVLFAPPLTAHLPAITAPRATFDAVWSYGGGCGTLGLAADTPRAGDTSPAPSALLSTPAGAGSRFSRWPSATTPAASPVLASQSGRSAPFAQAEQQSGPEPAPLQRVAAVPAHEAEAARRDLQHTAQHTGQHTAQHTAQHTGQRGAAAGGVEVGEGAHGGACQCDAAVQTGMCCRGQWGLLALAAGAAGAASLVALTLLSNRR
eukprot:jgi/Ulvmu1/3735/UM173_0008.1